MHHHPFQNIKRSKYCFIPCCISTIISSFSHGTSRVIPHETRNWSPILEMIVVSGGLVKFEAVRTHIMNRWCKGQPDIDWFAPDVSSEPIPCAVHFALDSERCDCLQEALRMPAFVRMTSFVDISVCIIQNATTKNPWIESRVFLPALLVDSYLMNAQ